MAFFRSLLKIEMRELLKDIFSYRLRGREIPKDLSFLDEREEKFSEPTATGASIQTRDGPAPVFLEGNHPVLETSGAPKYTFCP